MIGQVPPDTCDLPMINPDFNGNSWKDLPPRVPVQDDMHPVNSCPELSKLLDESVDHQDQSPRDEAAGPHKPIAGASQPHELSMPSVVVGSVGGNVGLEPAVDGGDDTQKTDETDQHQDQISRRKRRPIRGRRVNYLFEMLESMKQTGPSLPNGDLEETPFHPAETTTPPSQAASPCQTAPPSPGASPSPADLSMTCEEDELDSVQLSDSKGHAEALAKYKEEMEAYFEEMEMYFIQKHGLDKKKPDPPSDSSTAGPDEIVSVSRGTQATPTGVCDESGAIGPALELNLTEPSPGVSGESCYTRELEALTVSIGPSASLPKIPTTQTRMHLCHSSAPPRNSLCHHMPEKNPAPPGTTQPMPPSMPPLHCKTASPKESKSSSPGGIVRTGGTVDRKNNHKASSDGNNKKSAEMNHKKGHMPSGREALVEGRTNLINAYLNLQSGISPPVTGSSGSRETHQVTQSDGHPFSSKDRVVNMDHHKAQSRNSPADSLGGTLDTNCQVTPSIRSIPTTGNLHPQPRSNGDGSGFTARDTANQQFTGPSAVSNMATILNAPNQIALQRHNPYRLAGHHQSLNPARYPAPIFPGGVPPDGNYLQPSGPTLPPSQRLPGGANGGYLMYHPQFAHYGQYLGMNRYQNPVANIYPPPNTNRGVQRQRETPSPGEGNPPKRRRSSSGSRGKRPPPGRQTQVSQRQESPNTYHYQQNGSVADHFEKSYQEIANRKNKGACSNITVNHPWLPFTSNNPAQQPSQQLPSNFLPGNWPYGQQNPDIGHRPPLSSNVDDRGARMPSFNSDRPTNPLSAYPPPAYRPTVDPSLHQQQYSSQHPIARSGPSHLGPGMEAPSQPQQNLTNQPTQSQSTHPSQGMRAPSQLQRYLTEGSTQHLSTQLPPTLHGTELSLQQQRYTADGPTQQHQSTQPCPVLPGQSVGAQMTATGHISPSMLPMLHHFLPQGNLFGQMPLLTNNSVPPMNVQHQKLSVPAKQPPPSSRPDGENDSPSLEATTRHQMTSNIQRAVPQVQNLLSTNTASPSLSSTPVAPGELISAGITENGALDLSQRTVLPQIINVRSHGGQDAPRTDPQGTPQEPVMPKIVMVHSGSPPTNPGGGRPFSESLKEIASSKVACSSSAPQLEPSVCHVTGNELPPMSSAELVPTGGTTMRLEDHVSRLVGQLVSVDSILSVPNFRASEPPSYQAQNRVADPKAPEKSNGKKVKKSKKKKKSREKPVDSGSVRTKATTAKGVSPVPELPPHFLRVPDMTKTFTSLEGTENVLQDNLYEEDPKNQCPQVPCSSQNSLQATQEWVNKQFSHAYQDMSASKSVELAPSTPTTRTTPVLSSLLAQTIVSYQSPYTLTPQQRVSSITSVDSPNLALAPNQPVPETTAAATIVNTNSLDKDLPPPSVANEMSEPNETRIATENISVIQSKESGNHREATCTGSLTAESIMALVDTWEDLNKTGSGGIIADAANAAGITDSEEEEIVISIPFSDADVVNECPNVPLSSQASGPRQSDAPQEENIFDQLGSFVSDLEKGPRKENEAKDELRTAQAKAHPKGPSGKRKNCTLRLVPRKHSGKDVRSDYPNHKILSSTSSSKRLSSTHAGKPGSPHRKQELSDRYHKKNSKSGGKHHHKLLLKGGSKHMSSDKSAGRHSPSHYKDRHHKGSKNSSSRDRARHSSFKSSSKAANGKQIHHAHQKTLSVGKINGFGSSAFQEQLLSSSKIPLMAKSPLKDSGNVSSNLKTTGKPQDNCKMDKYYGYKNGSLPHHEHNTRFRIVCCHCEEMMPDNVAYMEHVASVIERSIPPSRMKQLCKVCHKTHPKNLPRHIRKAHLHGGNFLCKICNLNFHDQGDLKVHMKRIHKGLTMPYVCRICLFQTSFHSDLKEHFVLKHRGTKALLCHFCMKILYSSRSFLSHFTKHFAKESGVPCSDCALLFLTNTAHKEHAANEHDQLGWMDKDGLPKHYELPDLEAISLEAAEKAKQIRKTPADPSSQMDFEYDDSVQKAWKCLECGGSFIDLTEHLITEHECQSCDYSTNCSSTYTQHVVSFHSSFQDPPKLHPIKKKMVFGGQLIHCQKCGYKTSYATNMAKHVVCCPEGVSVVDSFDYLRHRALKEIALREKFSRKEEDRTPEVVITVVPDD